MTRDRNILDELFEISPQVANISNRVCYEAPEGYFDNLPSLLLQRVMQEKFSETTVEELEMLSPLLNNISKKMPYELGENYFSDLSSNVVDGVKAIDIVNDELENLLPELDALKNRQVFTAPADYFDNLPQIILEKAKESVVKSGHTKVVKGNFKRNVVKYFAVAAAITGLIFLTSKMFFSNNPADVNTASITDIENEVKMLSDSELKSFVEKNTLAGSLAMYNDSSMLRGEDVQLMLADVSDKELQQYLLEQTGTKANPIN